jgi:hypothetical protein
MKITLNLTTTQAYALSAAVDSALDEIYHAQNNGMPDYGGDDASELEELRNIINKALAPARDHFERTVW